MRGAFRAAVPIAACLLTVLALCAGSPTPVRAVDAPEWQIPVEVRRLENGLTVVVSEDHSAPTFGISVVYRVGFRLEPRGRTGFAHLFEHMMFQGTPNAPKGTFDRVIEGGGGVNNGSTRYDYTNYIASAPVSALEPILWLEADRMRGLDFSKQNLDNQRDVVKEEIRVNVQNQPYGGFSWIDIGTLTFDRWENGHDGYGSFKDLDAATVEDVASFHRTYYAPNNAVLALAGDLDPKATFALIEKYFGSIPAQPPPQPAETQEGPNAKERTLVQEDSFAQVPALAVAWKVPDVEPREWMALAVLGRALAAGEASRLYQRFVKGEEILLNIEGGLGWPLGDFLSMDTPTILNFSGLYKPGVEARAIVDGIQSEIDRIVREGIPAAEIESIKTKMLADHYAGLEMMIMRADQLGITQLLTGDARSINAIPGRIAGVSSQDVQAVAARILVPANRAFIDRQPVAAASEDAPPAGGGKS